MIYVKTEQIKQQLKQILSPPRFLHSLAVSRVAADLAERYGTDAAQAGLAGLLHDCARDMTAAELGQLVRDLALDVDKVEMQVPALLHAPVGAALLPQRYGIDDPDICRAVRWHTVGTTPMTLLDKVVYLADYIEPGRQFPGVDNIRDMAGIDLDRALLTALEQSIEYIGQRGGVIHPGTLQCRDGLLRAN
ncbi:MAG TPA: bis(5'-nucleosyl)-tetraphosphatase (symmetrical) YqeK [Patescibacteria group bacterium]|nr:bis(5'-nucleosyl)-tetraphosphatase (symmetrical) YqeK [Patescibacteria group bacterium]